MAVTRIGDVVVPEVFDKYIQQLTQEKSRIIQSGILISDASLAEKLRGGGFTFQTPSFKDLENDSENISSDDPDIKSVPNKIEMATEIEIRMNRNQSWSSMDLTAEIIVINVTFTCLRIV